MIVYTYLLMVASFGTFANNGVEYGYPNTTLQLQASQYNVGYAESSQPNPTFTSSLELNVDIMHNGETDQDYIYFHNATINTGTTNWNSPSEPHYISNVSSNVVTMGGTRLALTQFAGSFSVGSFTRVTSAIMRFTPSFYIDTQYNWSHTYTYTSYDDSFPNWAKFNSPNYTFSYAQIYNEYQNKLTLDTTRNNFNEGYEIGYTDGFSDGKIVGYADGYNNGFREASDVDTTALTIFNGILNVGMLPVNVFLAMLNFNVLGINISALVSSALTISLTIIVIRTFTGGNKEDK